jgi:glutathione S-transferase
MSLFPHYGTGSFSDSSSSIPESTLIYRAFCPQSRTVILGMNEMHYSCHKKVEGVGEKNAYASEYNPQGVLPVLHLHHHDHEIASGVLIALYLRDLDTTPQNFSLWGHDMETALEIRRLWMWFEVAFFQEIIYGLLYERFILPRIHVGHIRRSEVVQNSRRQIKDHLGYFDSLLESRSFLAGDRISWADCAGAAHVSLLEYFGEVEWSSYSSLKTWYRRIKSRPSFRNFLQEVLPEVGPHPSYPILDF